jgi:hypothetical protein
MTTLETKIIYKNNLKTQKGQWEAANRGTDNAMAKGIKIRGQTMIYKTLKIEQHVPH